MNASNARSRQSDRPGRRINAVVSIPTPFGQSDSPAKEGLAAKFNAAAERDHPVARDGVRIDVTAMSKRPAMNIGAKAEFKLPIRVQGPTVSDARLVAGSTFNSFAL